MASFDQQFADAHAKGESVYFKGTKIERIDRFPVKSEDVLFCTIEEAVKKDLYLQGFCIKVTGHAEVDGKIFKQGKGIRLHFWDGFCDNGVIIKVFTKLDHVIVYNVCERDVTYLANDVDGSPLERHSKTLDYCYNGAAMIIEEIEGGRRYRCSDTSSAEKPFPFNDIVFTVKKLPS
ncbi:MAG: hypothetical protein KGI80_05145 [Verrucomicrobiota bacterium]|nr:hypothetical protein [Verrucomicrobiota bacterium]